MSFSQKTKSELARVLPVKKCCSTVELAALIELSGEINQISRSCEVFFQTENTSVIRKFYFLCKKLFDLEKEVYIEKGLKLRKNNVYTLKIIPQKGSEKLLKELPIDVNDIEKELFLKRRCCQKTFLRGSFLAAGSINNPRQGNYHLEITADYKTAEFLTCLMKNFNCHPSFFVKKNNIVLYLKESEKIVNFLNATGAHSALLYFEDVRVRKDVINRVNRLVNCETANLNKSVEAGLKQTEDINYLVNAVGLNKLSPGLRQLANARLEHPGASLKELGELMDPPLSKSAVNHRMRRLCSAAKKLKEKK